MLPNGVARSEIVVALKEAGVPSYSRGASGSSASCMSSVPNAELPPWVCSLLADPACPHAQGAQGSWTSPC